jgi:hypothetical protein
MIRLLKQDEHEYGPGMRTQGKRPRGDAFAAGPFALGPEPHAKKIWRQVMPVEIVMPKLGLTMTEGLIVEWRKKEGTPSRKGRSSSSSKREKVT